VPSNLLPLMGQASAAWAELTKQLAARVEINKALPPPTANDDGLEIQPVRRRAAADVALDEIAAKPTGDAHG